MVELDSNKCTSDDVGGEIELLVKRLKLLKDKELDEYGAEIENDEETKDELEACADDVPLEVRPLRELDPNELEELGALTLAEEDSDDELPSEEEEPTEEDELNEEDVELAIEDEELSIEDEELSIEDEELTIEADDDDVIIDNVELNTDDDELPTKLVLEVTEIMSDDDEKSDEVAAEDRDELLEVTLQRPLGPLFVMITPSDVPSADMERILQGSNCVKSVWETVSKTNCEKSNCVLSES